MEYNDFKSAAFIGWPSTVTWSPAAFSGVTKIFT